MIFTGLILLIIVIALLVLLITMVGNIAGDMMDRILEREDDINHSGDNSSSICRDAARCVSTKKPNDNPNQ